MKDAITGKTLEPKLTTDWEALRTMGNPDIHAGIEADPDAQVTDEDFWKGTKVVYPKPKTTHNSPPRCRPVGVVQAAERLSNPYQCHSTRLHESP